MDLEKVVYAIKRGYFCGSVKLCLFKLQIRLLNMTDSQMIYNTTYQCFKACAQMMTTENIGQKPVFQAKTQFLN